MSQLRRVRLRLMALMALDCNAIWVWEMAEERSGSFMVLIIILIITKIKKNS